MLRHKLVHLERQLVSKLAELRETFHHAGNKGTGVEAAVRDLLRLHLPRTYAVGHGEVVDTYGASSGQVDIVVQNEEQPRFVDNDEAPSVFIVEGVSAVGESKAMLTAEHLNGALANAAKLKHLRCRHEGFAVTVAHGTANPLAKCPPYFLLAFESQLSLTTVRDRLAKAQDGELAPIDAAFVIGSGWIINFPEGGGGLRFRRKGEEISGWVLEEEANVLGVLLTWLMGSMPRVQRFTPAALAYLIDS